jgi:hypothetical protein
VTPEEREALLAGLALGSLSEPDARDAERLVRVDEAAAREYEAYRELADMIALSVPLRHADPALRERVLAAARRNPAPWRQHRHWRRYVPAAAMAAALVLVSGWAISLHATVDGLRAEQAQLAAIVEADAKRLDALGRTSVSSAEAANLGIRLETALKDQQVILAVQSDPDARRTQLDKTSAAHGAHGQYLWSDTNAAGVLLVYDLPPLGVGDTYKVWLQDAQSRMVLSATFNPDAHGDAAVALAFDPEQQPVLLYLVASSAGGTDGPVVLQATMSRDGGSILR